MSLPQFLHLTIVLGSLGDGRLSIVCGIRRQTYHFQLTRFCFRFRINCDVQHRSILVVFCLNICPRFQQTCTTVSKQFKVVITCSAARPVLFFILISISCSSNIGSNLDPEEATQYSAIRSSRFYALISTLRSSIEYRFHYIHPELRVSGYYFQSKKRQWPFQHRGSKGEQQGSIGKQREVPREHGRIAREEPVLAPTIRIKTAQGNSNQSLCTRTCLTEPCVLQ